MGEPPVNPFLKKNITCFNNICGGKAWSILDAGEPRVNRKNGDRYLGITQPGVTDSFTS